ncbi:MAG: prolipoprotein diacylglyceryl transferase [Acholeplasmataceae bacterium]|nr:prolipoprotein diacylglyceryl transferase [Acholeplasmataceae bacterium]
MYPYLFPEIFNDSVPMYYLMIFTGISFMLIYVTYRFENRDGFTRKQTNRLLLLISISLLFAWLFSFLLDAVFHTIQEGELTLGSINFLGGLIGGFAAFLLLMKYFYKDKNKDLKRVANTIITGVVLAHAFGRIGCFCAGCCFGIPTDTFLGVVFPYGHAHTLFPDTSVFPTQLFESAFLFILFILLNQVKSFRNKEVQIYLIGYGVWRILIEFIRGDDRGALLPLFSTQYNVFPTPSQLISFFMIIFGIYLLYQQRNKMRITYT